jgi:internalin A
MPDTVHVSHAVLARPRVRFGVRSLLTATTIACVLLALLAQPIIEARRQQSLLDQVAAQGAKITVIGSVNRESSLGRFVLGLFDASYSRVPLYVLDFSGTQLSDEELRPVAQITYIKELKLDGTQVSDAAFRHLGQLEFLERLDLGNTEVTDEGIAQLNDLRHLASLRVVGTKVSYDALERLDAELPYAHFCEERAIDESKAAGIQVVDPPRHVEAPHDHSVIQAGREAVYAVIGMNRKISLTAQDVLHLGYLRSLHNLTFHTVTLGPAGLNALRPLPKLNELSISFVNLTDWDLKSLSKQLQLESLTLYECDGITDAGVAEFKTLKKLKTLSIKACRGVTKEAVSSLASELPSCQCDYSK